MTIKETSDMIKQYDVCVIVPTYNNAGTLLDILRRIEVFTHNIIVVNDGSTDSTHDILSSCKNIKTIEYACNRGKGYALIKGFECAVGMAYRYAVTIDSDGQHYPEDLPLMISAMRDNPAAIVVGCRDIDQSGMPRGNNFANKFSNFWFYLHTGVNLRDTQSGYRVYPLNQISVHWPITARYESELELLVFSSWSGTDIAMTAVRVNYADDRVSHFRPFMDFMRITILNSCLCIVALPMRIIKILRK